MTNPTPITKSTTVDFARAAELGCYLEIAQVTPSKTNPAIPSGYDSTMVAESTTHTGFVLQTMTFTGTKIVSKDSGNASGIQLLVAMGMTAVKDLDLQNPPSDYIKNPNVGSITIPITGDGQSAIFAFPKGTFMPMSQSNSKVLNITFQKDLNFDFTKYKLKITLAGYYGIYQPSNTSNSISTAVYDGPMTL